MVALQFQFSSELGPELSRPQGQVLQPRQSDQSTTGSGNDKAAQLLLLNKDAAQRHSLQQFIADGFHHAYGANVQTFMPDLLAVQAKGQWQAVLGVRSGTNVC
ncbi:MAG TPA: hypothetical protein DF774_14155 [Rheinheimera sp.]|uniref:thermostable hemolysin n=1 Tax=Rheinheimera sp. TaxID=1869214 RepID=UPI000EEFDAA6|nr:thermostable hemolysin [Rheinheimera sp.]HCU66895.1 hypothetical protein [Rheinheimera sp.]